MADRPVRVGIVGLGHNGMAHLEAHASCPRSEVVAVCDVNPGLVAAAGERFGIAERYTDDAIFADPRIEADYIHNLFYQANQTDPVTGRNWYLEQEIPMVGGGSHALDLLRWISGKEVTRVWGYANHESFPAMTNDDCQVCLFRFADGAIAKVAALYGPRAPMPPFNNLRIYGTNGTVERDAVGVSGSPEDVHPVLQPVGGPRVQGHPYLPEIEDWLVAIQTNGPPRTPLWDGANSTIATLAAARALREGVEVDVPRFRPLP
jgi:predicted dehydrogenase